MTGAALTAQAPVTGLPFTTARPVLEALREDLRPAVFRGKSLADVEAAWPGWIEGRNRDIRTRVAQGDEDSIVNLLLFGTSFTGEARLTEADLAAGFPTRSDVVSRRIADLIRAVAVPGDNERLQFVRTFAERQGMNPTTRPGAELLREYLEEGVDRVVAERREIAERASAAIERVLVDPGTGLPEAATLYADRGLASDTSIFINFAVDAAIEAIAGNQVVVPGSIGRVAVIGPGLDFADKREGHDFYPQQTMQPFAVTESVVRRKLAAATGVDVVAFDLSPRIIQHIETARRRADAGEGYLLQLPRETSLEWNPNLVAYWKTFGAAIGGPDRAVAVPRGLPVDIRGVRVRPDVVRRLQIQDVNVVLQQTQVPPFDLIVATNVLVYYDVFEQSLALANITGMLRPGGLLLTNTPLFVLPGVSLTQIGYTDVVYTREASSRDRIFWYRRD